MVRENKIILGAVVVVVVALVAALVYRQVASDGGDETAGVEADRELSSLPISEQSFPEGPFEFDRDLLSFPDRRLDYVEPSEDEARGDLLEWADRLGYDPAKVAARYESLRSRVPEPRIRAAVALLEGTFAAPLAAALEADGDMSDVDFLVTALGNDETHFARIGECGPLSRFTVAVTERALAEPLPAVAAVVMHELGHLDAVGKDNYSSRVEHAVIYWLETGLWASFIAAYPDIVNVDGNVVAALNSRVAAMVNSSIDTPGITKPTGNLYRGQANDNAASSWLHDSHYISDPLHELSSYRDSWAAAMATWVGSDLPNEGYSFNIAGSLDGWGVLTAAEWAGVIEALGGKPMPLVINAGITNASEVALQYSPEDLWSWVHHTEGDEYTAVVSVTNRSDTFQPVTVALAPMSDATWLPRTLRIEGKVAPSSFPDSTYEALLGSGLPLGTVGPGATVKVAVDLRHGNPDPVENAGSNAAWIYLHSGTTSELVAAGWFEKPDSSEPPGEEVLPLGSVAILDPAPDGNLGIHGVETLTVSGEVVVAAGEGDRRVELAHADFVSTVDRWQVTEGDGFVEAMLGPSGEVSGITVKAGAVDQTVRFSVDLTMQTAASDRLGRLVVRLFDPTQDPKSAPRTHLMLDPGCQPATDA